MRSGLGFAFFLKECCFTVRVRVCDKKLSIVWSGLGFVFFLKECCFRVRVRVDKKLSITKTSLFQAFR